MQSRELLTSGKLIPRLLLVAGLTSGELRGDRREVPRSTKDQTASCARSDGILFVCPWVPDFEMRTALIGWRSSRSLNIGHESIHEGVLCTDRSRELGGGWKTAMPPRPRQQEWQEYCTGRLRLLLRPPPARDIELPACGVRLTESLRPEIACA
jgi:hypothetical protein